MRAQHRRLLANQLWRGGRTSRADLARATGLSRSTVSAITDDLIRAAWVRELGAGSSRGGRRPVVLSFNDDCRLAAGVDMGANHVSVALTNLGGQVRVWRHRSFPVRDNPEGTIALINRLLREVFDEEPASRARVLGIGVAVPSPVIDAEPNRLPALIMPRWVGHDLVAALHAAHGLAVAIENDANLGALAELRWGLGRDRQHLTFIKLATGIGAGMIVNGGLFRGFNGIAGEIAHTSINADGAECICGQRGCLVLLAGSAALIARARAAGASRPAAALPEPLDTESLVDAALAGNKLASEVIAKAGEWIGIGVANLLNVVDPGMVVLGGELTRAGRILIEPIIKTVRERALSMAIAPTQIVTSELKDRGVALGAAAQVIDEAFERDDLFEPQDAGPPSLANPPRSAASR